MKNMINIPTPQEAIDYYRSIKPQGSVEKMDAHPVFPDSLIDPSNNNHFWYMTNFPKANEARFSALRKLDIAKPWEKTSPFKNFEELREDIKGTIYAPYIRNLVVYDVALKIAKNCARDLLPKEYVYIHAKPWKTARILMPAWIAGYKITHNTFRIPKTAFPVEFSSLSAAEIEDLLCCIYKYIFKA